MPDSAAIQRLTETLPGRLIQPGEPGYEQARRVWNGMIDRRPAMIVRCQAATDVVEALGFAREHDLPLSVKGGGHGVSGKAVCDGGLMIDLSPMNRVEVDAGARIARVEAGATWADVDHETQAFGLATTGGFDSRTGVAGLTLGGGVGYLARRCGLTVDNLLSADVITADGARVRVSETDHDDLFWAARGGGGNFGIVTAFELRLHDVGPDVLTAQIFHPIEDAAEVLRCYRDVMARAADELGCYALVVRVPPAPPFPEQRWGSPAVALVACCSGSVEDGYARLAPLEELGTPFFKAVQPMPYAVLQQNFDAGTPNGGRYYWKSHYLEALSDDAIDTLVTHVATAPGPLSIVGFEPMGGAVARVEPSATAFPHRSAAFALGIWSGWTDPGDDEENIAWTRACHRSMAGYATGGTYVNYLDQDDGERAVAAYGDNYERLRSIKARYDPDGIFNAHQKIDPTG